MSRNSKGSGIAYSKIAGSVGLQVACMAGEAIGAMTKGTLDMIAQTTSSTADDTAFPWLSYAAGNILRFTGGKWLSKEHPGFAQFVQATGSAMNGAVILDGIRRRVAMYKEKEIARAQKSDSQQ